MQISKTQSNEPLSKTTKIGAAVFLLLGVIGFLDATYLYLEHLRGTIPACNVIKGCDQVLVSSYSTIGPVPLALLGSIYYLIIIVGALIFFDTKKVHFLHLLSAFTLVGIFASLYFLYLQFFIIKALCIYCLFSAATSTLLFVNGYIVFKKTK